MTVSLDPPGVPYIGDAGLGIDIEMSRRHGRHGRPQPSRVRIERVATDIATMDIPSLDFYEQHGGHTLRRHVATTAQQDVQRLEREPDIGAAGSFLTQEIAQAALEATIRDHAAEIERWLARGGNGPFVAETFFKQQVGSVLTRAAFRRNITEPAPATGARIVLRRDDSLPGGFLVRTFYTVLAPDQAPARLTSLTTADERTTMFAPYLVTRSELNQRLEIDPQLSRALRFTDETLAERAIDDALEHWGTDIRRWVRFGGAEEYRAVHRVSEPVGEALHRDRMEAGEPPEPIQKIRFVLRRTPDNDDGFTVTLAEPYVAPAREDATR
jgi:hypothetical protein